MATLCASCNFLLFIIANMPSIDPQGEKANYQLAEFHPSSTYDPLRRKITFKKWASIPIICTLIKIILLRKRVYSMDMEMWNKHGHAAWTRTSRMNKHDRQYGMDRGMDMHRGHGHAPWTCIRSMSMDMPHGQGQTHGHGHADCIVI
jgi:hypothetical protein